MTASQAIPKTNRGTRLRNLFSLQALENAEAALQAYYQAVDVGAKREEINATAEEVCQAVGPMLLAIARRVVPRRTGLRGTQSWHVIEEVQEAVLVSLLTRVRPGSTKWRFNPSKRDFAVFAWVLVDRAVISGYCRRRVPCSFTQVDFRESLVACHRQPVVLDELVLQEKLAETREAVDRLDDPTREVVRRVCLEGEGKKLVATSLGRSPAFVTRELARGMSRLARCLAEGREQIHPRGLIESKHSQSIPPKGFWVDA